MRCSGAEIIIKLLEQEGVEIVAGIPGGANLPLYDALYKSKIRHVLARHEQGAGFIAQGMARSTGRPAVCLATSGPGATNLLTAIADAKMDSVPLIAITGQVASDLIGSDAFQEVDTYGLTVPITKHNYLANSAAELLHIIPEAFRLTQSDRPGPVVIDVPKDVQTQQIEIDEWPRSDSVERDTEVIDKMAIQAAAELIAKAKRPVLYIGGGIVQSGASTSLIKLARKNSIPVVTTLMGLGSFPDNDPLNLGMLGMHGSRYANYIINEADLLLAFGVRFDDRATGNIRAFCPEAAVIHADIDPAELDKLRTAHVSVRGDIGGVINQLLPLVEVNHRWDWLTRVDEVRSSYPFVMPGPHDHYHPLNLIRYLGQQVSPETIITTDVGQHQMWVAQAYPFSRPRTLLTSGSLGTMGFGLPAAIGAALANPGKRVLCFSGDGSILMNIQELATLADWQLNIAIILFNNGHLGLVRQQQELFYGGHYIASRFRTSPNFAALARSFGIRGYDLDPNDDPYLILQDCLQQTGPCLINVPIDSCTNVFPIVPPGKAIYEMIGGEQHA
ncbi:MAG: biosynthetic-type acetolactate synthase large subunit [Deltaproteobacteria bacterium]